MNTTSKEWNSNPGMISDKLYRVNSKQMNNGMVQVWLEVQHLPGKTDWTYAHGHDASILIPRLKSLNGELWAYMGGRGGNTKTLARLTEDNVTYETSTDEGATWRETDHPYALAKRILELDPA